MLCSSHLSDESTADSPRPLDGSNKPNGDAPPPHSRISSNGCSNTDGEATRNLNNNGCCASGAKPPLACGSKSNVKPWYRFSESEKELLRLSWRPVFANLEQFGVEIYVMIFEQCPEARELFPFMRDVINVEKARKDYSTEFSFQALRFVQILESGVNALDDLSNLDLLLHNLGRRHGKLDATNIFRPYYWSVFLECAIHKLRSYITIRGRRSTSSISDEEEVNRAIILWRRLLEGIIERIEAGFIVDIANRRLNAEQRGATNPPKWKYTGLTRAGWITANSFKSTESLIQTFSPFKTSPLRTRSRSRDTQRLQQRQSPKK